MAWPPIQVVSTPPVYQHAGANYCLNYTSLAIPQNSDCAHLPGTSHALDRDVFFGALADLQKYRIV